MAKKEKKQINEELIDQIVQERKKEKNLKEQIYDKINVPVWLLDLIIVGCVAALAYIIIFKRA